MAPFRFPLQITETSSEMEKTWFLSIALWLKCGSHSRAPSTWGPKEVGTGGGGGGRRGWGSRVWSGKKLGRSPCTQIKRTSPQDRLISSFDLPAVCQRPGGCFPPQGFICLQDGGAHWAIHHGAHLVCPKETAGREGPAECWGEPMVGRAGPQVDW